MTERHMQLMRSSIIHASLLVAALVAAPAFAQQAASAGAPTSAGAGAIATVQARVIGIDPLSNSVTLQGPRGRVVDVAVNPEVGDVGKLQVGDTVNIEYQNALLIRATKVASNGIRERIDESATVPASGGVTATARRVQVLATIQKVDRKARLVTLRGPTRTETFHTSPELSLDGLKAGDTVKAEFVSATAVQVLRNGAPIK